MVPFSVVKNIQMYPFPEGSPQAERVVIKYFGRGRDIHDTQAKSGILNFSMYMLGCKVFIRKNYLYAYL